MKIASKLLFCSLLSLGLLYGQNTQAIVKEAKELAAARDDIGLRILLRKNFKRKLTPTEWLQIRMLLQKRPNIGFDVMRAWDMQVSVKTSVFEKEALKVAKNLEKADSLMFAKKFSEAFTLYQRVAKYVKAQSGGRIKRDNQQLYLNILHQMGRALFAMKKFEQSIEVYSWIPPVYGQIRQVMFEKMWAGFRANKYDVALGSIASQQSDFFSQYLNPESYLLKIYILKRLCRNEEVRTTIASIKEYLVRLRNNQMSYIEWAKNDLFRMSLAKLLTPPPEDKKFLPLMQYASEKERDDEKQKIINYLQMKFNQEKPMLIGSLEKILGYAALAMSEDQKLLSKVNSLPDSDILESKGYEIWPAHTSEEWTDEIGSHYFIGDSQCAGK